MPVLGGTLAVLWKSSKTWNHVLFYFGTFEKPEIGGYNKIKELAQHLYLVTHSSALHTNWNCTIQVWTVVVHKTNFN
jgi:hypothetical protein